MSEQPLVVCVMLTRDRPEMARRAVRSFEAQTYQNKMLFILDTGSGEFPIKQENGIYAEYWPNVEHSIGMLRNLANAYANPYCLNTEIIIHFDDDDYSHPNRIAEQVALLQASGKECVGYRRVPFLVSTGEHLGAWEYSNDDPRYCIGSSLAYLRSAWERNPFKDRMCGEDKEFVRAVDSMGVDCFIDGEPRMVCSIHGGNTSSTINLASPNWKRVKALDSKLESIMGAYAR